MHHADPSLRLRPLPPGPRHRFLATLLLGSVALHALMLAWQPATPPLWQAEPSGRGVTLGLQLSSGPNRQPETPTPRGAETAAAPTPARVAAPVESPARTVASATPSAPRATPASRPPPAAAAPPQRPSPAATASPHPRPAQTAVQSTAHPAPRHAPVAATAPVDNSPHSAVLSEIGNALQQHFFYPRLARLRNWEGDVLLGFQLHSDGRIDDIEVLESSGRAVLDQAALNALRSVRQVAYNANHPVELQLPVVYRLQ